MGEGKVPLGKNIRQTYQWPTSPSFNVLIFSSFFTWNIFETCSKHSYHGHEGQRKYFNVAVKMIYGTILQNGIYHWSSFPLLSITFPAISQCKTNFFLVQGSFWVGKALQCRAYIHWYQPLLLCEMQHEESQTCKILSFFSPVHLWGLITFTICG